MATEVGGNLLQMLVDEKLVTQDQLKQALEAQTKQGGSLGFNLALLGFASEEEVARVTAMAHNLEYVDLSTTEVDPEALQVITQEMASKAMVLPIRRRGNTVVVAVVDPSAHALADLAEQIRFRKNLKMELAVAPESYVRISVEHYYGQLAAILPPPEPAKTSSASAPAAAYVPPAAPAREYNIQELVAEASGEGGEIAIMEDKKEEELGNETADDSIVIRICNTIINEAVAKRVSDIHIEPFEKRMMVRYRIDGTLIEQPAPPVNMKRSITARFKVMSKLNIVEKRKPQDGRIKIRVKDRMIDLRVATIPVQWGEKIVMRILDQQNLQTDLNKLGFEEFDLKRFNNAIRTPYGIVLVTGPTGSGKTTTLYSALTNVADPKKNVMTAEDPIEYQLPGINQVPVNPEIGMTFAVALKSFLRCDPNIVMVGEIRDLETADIAIKAAMTGQLVLSTLHTNDAPSTINRMVDMGIQPFYLGTTLIMIVAQRLMKGICPDCREEVQYEEAFLTNAGFDLEELKGKTLYRGRGCSTCGGTGYKGRKAIYEVMPISDKLRSLIFKNVDTPTIRQAAIDEGMSSLRMSAVKKLLAGVTTVEEVMRVTLAE